METSRHYRIGKGRQTFYPTYKEWKLSEIENNPEDSKFFLSYL